MYTIKSTEYAYNGSTVEDMRELGKFEINVARNMYAAELRYDTHYANYYAQCWDTDYVKVELIDNYGRTVKLNTIEY